MPVAPHFADGDDEIARRNRILVHRAAVGEAGEPDLRDVRAGSPSSISARTGLPLLSPSCVSRMSKCASRVISPTFSSGMPSPSTAGRVTALLPPTSNVSAWSCALDRDRFTDRSGRFLDRQPGKLDVAMIGDLRGQLARRFRRRSGRSAAASGEAAPAPGRTGPASPTGGERRPDQPDRRACVSVPTIRSERFGQPLMALTVATALA